MNREEYPAEVIERLMPGTVDFWQQLDGMANASNLTDAQRAAAQWASGTIMTLTREVAFLEHERRATRQP